jgi:hypothetical protein
MKLRGTILLAITCFTLLPCSGVSQVSEDPGVRSSIGFRIGYGLPIGDWAKSRVAPTVQMFGSGFTFGGDITIRLGQSWGLVLGGGHSILNASQWEDYANSKGDMVTVSASMTDFSISLRPYLKTTAPDLLSFEFGVVGMFPNGEEVVDGEIYSYDFFSDFHLGGQFALEYDRLVSEKVAFTARAGVIVVPDGLNYSDGQARTIIYVPLTVGIRFLL